MRRRSLSFKLLLSYVLVVAIASVAAFGVARWLGPRLFDHEVQQIGQRAGWVDGAPGNSGQGTGNGGTAGIGQTPGTGQPSDTAGTRGRGQGQGGSGSAGSGGTTVTTISTTTATTSDSTTTTTRTAVTPGIGLEAQQEAIDAELADAFTGSLTVAMLVALGVGLVAGFVAAALVSRRLLRPLDRIRSTVRRMAAGDHSQRVPVPPDRELADLATDVNSLGTALAETEERRARLVSDLSHELRTPITSLDGFLEGLEDGVFAPDAETLTAMRTETRRLERLAADLAVLSRTAEEAFDLQLRATDVTEVAGAAARALGGAAASKKVSIDTGGLAATREVAADPDRMSQVFTNLVRNAIQHTPSGGSVRLASRVDGDTLVVSVADTGPGIPDGSLQRVFDRFVRLDDGDGSGGAGIGLTIARGICRAHGGDLTAANDGGAVFTVMLPVS